MNFAVTNSPAGSSSDVPSDGGDDPYAYGPPGYSIEPPYGSLLEQPLSTLPPLGNDGENPHSTFDPVYRLIPSQSSSMTDISSVFHEPDASFLEGRVRSPAPYF